MRNRFSGLAFVAVSALVSSACSMLVDTSGLSGGGGNGDGGASSTSFGGNAPGASGADAGRVASDGGLAGPSPVSSSSGGNPAPAPAPLVDSGAGGATPDAGGGGGTPPIDSGTADTAPPPTPSACSAGVARVFVTSSLYDGNFGGVSGADSDCAASAAAAGIGGNWSAWMSDSVTPASSHVYAAPNGYVLLDGTVVAASFSALTSGTLSNAIDLTEQNAPPPDGNTEVWTGIDVTGQMAGGYCTDNYGDDWSSGWHGAPTPLVGHLDAADSTWTAAYLQYCDRTNVRIYCFESCP